MDGNKYGFVVMDGYVVVGKVPVLLNTGNVCLLFVNAIIDVIQLLHQEYDSSYGYIVFSFRAVF